MMMYSACAYVGQLLDGGTRPRGNARKGRVSHRWSAPKRANQRRGTAGTLEGTSRLRLNRWDAPALTLSARFPFLPVSFLISPSH
jgi:hypothetical protein